MHNATSRFNRTHHPLVRERLAEYAAGMASGASAEPVPRELAAHLRRCRYCRQWYAEVEQLAHDMYNASIPPAPVYPAVDLSFLRH